VKSKIFLVSLVVLLVFGLAFAGCAPDEPEEVVDEPEEVVDEPEEVEEEPDADHPDFPGYPADLVEAAQAEGRVNVYNWSFFIDDDRVETFEEKFGIDVTYDLYESNEEMKTKIMAGGSGYDVVYPSDHMVYEMRELGLLQELNHDWLPNMDDLMDMWVDPFFDPGNSYSVGYMWGTTGYAYNKEQVGDDPRLGSWALLFEGEEYAGRMTMSEDANEPVGAALHYLGYSANSEDPDELEEAREVLLQQNPWVSAYISGPVREQLIAGDIWIAQFWSGDTLWASLENPDIGYVVPEEGAYIWIDSMCIPADAPNPAAAHLWINYMMEPEVQAAIVEYVMFPSAIEGAQDYLDAEYLENPAIYPDEELFDRLELGMPFVGEPRDIRESIWEELIY